jgi:hypothetical protein
MRFRAPFNGLTIAGSHVQITLKPALSPKFSLALLNHHKNKESL